MKKKLLLIVIFFIFIAGVGACSNKKATKNVLETTETSNLTKASKTKNSQVALPTKDRTGEEIELPKKVSKIVSLAPAVSQVIVDLELNDKLVAIDAQVPLQMEGLEQPIAIKAEELIELKPDIIFISDKNEKDSMETWEKVKNTGISVVTVPTSTTIKDIALDVQFIADSLNEHKKGLSLVKKMNKDLEKINKIASKIEKKKNILFELSGAPAIKSFGKNIFLNEMISEIGANNILADKEGWISVTEEEVIASNPDVILTSSNSVPNPVEDILQRKGWESVTAIKNKEVYKISNASSLLANHHIIGGLKEIAQAVYPNEYKNLNF